MRTARPAAARGPCRTRRCPGGPRRGWNRQEREIAADTRTAPSSPVPLRAEDVLLDALAIRLLDGHTAAVPALARAQRAILSLNPGTDIDIGRYLWLVGMRAGGIVAGELWDDDARHTLAIRQVDVARNAGALVQLQYALSFLAWTSLDAGELAAAARLLDEDRLIADATGTSPVGFCAILLAGWQGAEDTAVERYEAMVRLASAGRITRLRTVADHAIAVLYNGLGQHDAARDVALRAFERGDLGYEPFVVAELAEAASRTHDQALISAAGLGPRPGSARPGPGTSTAAPGETRRHAGHERITAALAGAAHSPRAGARMALRSGQNATDWVQAVVAACEAGLVEPRHHG
jgi:hypothetical protein